MTEEFAGRYIPRQLFIPYHNRLERWAKIVAHRRAGKTVACINDLIARAMLNSREGANPPQYAYIGPTYSQAKDVAWDKLKQYAGPLAVEKNESDLWVRLPNRARIRLYGAENYDRLRGLYHDGVVIDEPADLSPVAWPMVIMPTLADFKGWATFIGTPRGHDWFFKVDLKPESTELADGWFRTILKASETGVLEVEELSAQRAANTPEQYAQEFECSFDAAIHGAYFAAGIGEARKEGRIGVVPADPVIQKRCFFDIGGGGDASDATAIWVCQFVKREIRVLDYIEAVSQPIGFYAHLLRDRGLDKAELVFPHDGLRKDHLSKSYEDHWRDAGWTKTRSIPNQGRGADLARVEAVRRNFPAIWFNEDTTKNGVEALAHYHEKWDEDRRMGMGPLHDWSSHAADAFGLMAICYEAPAARPKPLVFPNIGVA